MFLHRLPIFFCTPPNNNIILAVAGGTNGTPLTLNAVLDTFNYATGIASFSFYGYAYSNKGGSVYQTGDSSYIEGSVRAQSQVSITANMGSRLNVVNEMVPVTNKEVLIFTSQEFCPTVT